LFRHAAVLRHVPRHRSMFRKSFVYTIVAKHPIGRNTKPFPYILTINVRRKGTRVSSSSPGPVKALRFLGQFRAPTTIFRFSVTPSKRVRITVESATLTNEATTNTESYGIFHRHDGGRKFLSHTRVCTTKSVITRYILYGRLYTGASVIYKCTRNRYECRAVIVVVVCWRPLGDRRE